MALNMPQIYHLWLVTLLSYTKMFNSLVSRFTFPLFQLKSLRTSAFDSHPTTEFACMQKNFFIIKFILFHHVYISSNTRLSEIGGISMFENAIVIGGSIAGKIAAKALSESFRQVTIIEAGQEPTEKAPRKRVPQSYHPHVVLKGGEAAIEKLFPQITSELIEDGSTLTNFTGDLKWHHFGSWKKPFTGELIMVQQSQPMLDSHLQRRINHVSNITTRYETMSEQLLIDRQHNKVCGLRVRSLKTRTEEELSADLVVDASGFGSKSRSWLKTYGIEVKEERVGIQLFYASRLVRLKKEKRPDWYNLLISPSFPNNPYGAYIQTIEDDRFSVTFSGYVNERAPQTNEEFFSYAHKLPETDVLDFLKQAKPITDIKIHRIPYQVRRRFDLAKHIPGGFVVIGDAHCRFDPVFGQGISVAAMEAIELQRRVQHVTSLDQSFTKAYHKKISKIIATPWDMATTEALRHQNITGDRSLAQPMKQWYSKKVYELSASDPEIYIRLVRVMNLIRSPHHLFHPKVWLAMFKKKFS